MYMRITWGKVRQGQWLNFEATYHETAIDFRNIPGMRARWLVHDLADPDAGQSITLWDSLEALRQYEASDLYRHRIVPALQGYFGGAYTTKICKVGVMQLSDSWESNAAADGASYASATPGA